ncbi:uncharacterized protein LOC128884257 [Hylaeus volcanicus]|uniref:uncharacterized protein LOC128884257 n=1 Tax=Hylaeus volcanicus TaxID=313075 RepID=UPI0023B7A61F|nr:uncharacterized protein LOC128884257 [Hylaeus volcanicus]
MADSTATATTENTTSKSFGNQETCTIARTMSRHKNLYTSCFSCLTPFSISSSAHSVSLPFSVNIHPSLKPNHQRYSCYESCTPVDNISSCFSETDASTIVHLVPVIWLKPHEQCSYERYLEVFFKTIQTMAYDYPIIVDHNTGVILDGHHRFQVALALRLEVIPAVLVKYETDTTIRVVPWKTSHITSTLSSKEPSFSSHAIQDENHVFNPSDQSFFVTDNSSEFINSSKTFKCSKCNPDFMTCPISSTKKWGIFSKCNHNKSSCYYFPDCPNFKRFNTLLNPTSIDWSLDQRYQTLKYKKYFQQISVFEKQNFSRLLKHLVQNNLNFFTSEHRSKFNIFFTSRIDESVSSLLNQNTNTLLTKQSTESIQMSIEKTSKVPSSDNLRTPLLEMLENNSPTSFSFKDIDHWYNVLFNKNSVKSASIISKENVLKAGLSTALFPPKTTRHLFPDKMLSSSKFFYLYSLF